MSVITDVVLLVQCPSIEQVARIMGHEFDVPRKQTMGRLDTRPAGGTKWPSYDVFQAALNHVPADEVLTWFERLDVDDAILIVHSEYDPEPIVKTKGFS